MNRNKILPWVVLLLASLALLYFLNRGCAKQRATEGNSLGISATPEGNTAQNAAAGQSAQDLGFTADQVFAYALDKALQAGSVDPNTVFILNEVGFVDQGTTLTPLSYAQLDRFAKILRKYPDVKVRIEGHTDNTGALRDNLERSRLQALAVRDYLQGRGIDSRRIAIVGRGPYKPLEANVSGVAKAKNNRIEVYLIQ